MASTADEHQVDAVGIPSRVGSENRTAAQRTALRIGGVGALCGGLLTLVGNILHPREAGQLQDVETLLNVAAGSEIWVIDHFLILVAVSLLLAAFFGLGRSFISDAAHAWAQFAWTVSIVGVVFALALMVTEATAVAVVADQWATATGTGQDMALGAGSALLELSLVFSVGAMLFLFGATPLLFGVAMLTSDDYPSWIGGAGMIFGSVALAAGTIQILTQQTDLAQFVLFPVAAIGITLWIMYLGVHLLRQSNQTEGRT